MTIGEITNWFIYMLNTLKSFNMRYFSHLIFQPYLLSCINIDNRSSKRMIKHLLFCIINVRQHILTGKHYWIIISSSHYSILSPTSQQGQIKIKTFFCCSSFSICVNDGGKGREVKWREREGKWKMDIFVILIATVALNRRCGFFLLLQ